MSSKPFFKGLAYTPALALTLILAACGGGGGGGTSSDSGGASMGTFKVSLGDAPACGYDQVNVTVQKVRINASATAADTDAGWTDISLSPAKRFNLLTLSNGVLAELGQTPIAAGHYSQIALVLAPNDASNAMANSVVPTGGSEVALTTPSGQQSGLKLNADVTITANQIADFVLDFDACKSVVRAGSSGKYLLKPVISVTPNYISGVKGFVDTGLASGTTMLSVQQGGVVIKATAPDSTGMFLLQPVAPGNYDFVLTAPGRASTVITGVPVTANTVTSLSTSAAPLSAASAPAGTASGTVTSTVTPIDARVTASQMLTGGSTVTLASTAADAVSGVYSLSLPASGPSVAVYVAQPANPVFSIDLVVGNSYTLTAVSGGVSKTASPVLVPANATVTTNFSF